MVLDGCFQLLDILGPSLSESCLSLSVALLAFFGRGIYLRGVIQSAWKHSKHADAVFHTGFLPPFRFCTAVCSCRNCSVPASPSASASASASGLDSMELRDRSRSDSVLGRVAMSSLSGILTTDPAPARCTATLPAGPRQPGPMEARNIGATAKDYAEARRDNSHARVLRLTAVLGLLYRNGVAVDNEKDRGQEIHEKHELL